MLEGEHADLALASMGILLTYRVAISVRLDRAVIGRVHGDIPAWFSPPVPHKKVCSVLTHRFDLSTTNLAPSLFKGHLAFSPWKSSLTNVLLCFEVRTLC